MKYWVSQKTLEVWEALQEKYAAILKTKMLIYQLKVNLDLDIFEWNR